MRFAIDDAHLPATLTAHPMTDEQFAQLCAEHPDLFLEMTSEGDLLVMPPTHSLAAVSNGAIVGQLGNWARTQSLGLVSGPSGGFLLPNGARRSPDAAWTSKARLKQLTKKSLAGFWHLSPDFVIELKSDTDRLPVLRKKMAEWIENGATLAWLINPDSRAVEVYRPGTKPMKANGGALQSIRGEGPVEGFVLDLNLIWNPMA
ncbi:MAG TPA: Uma2 family endonuclease [Bryobacteraceae bacterium]|jgi:Uma2 family endonuclease